MARFETLVTVEEASVFDSALWAFLARMLGCDVPVRVIHHYPDRDGERWVVEMDDEDHLQEFAAETRRLSK